MAAKLEGRFVQSTPEQVRARSEALVPYTSQASGPPDKTGQPSSFRVITKVWLGTFLASIGTLFIGGDVALPLGIFGLIFSVAGLLLTGINDLAQPSARGRATPEAAIKCYFRGVRWRRWREAFVALGRPAHDKQVDVPKIKALQSERDTLSISNADQLKRYWRTLSMPSKAMTRRMTGFDIERLATHGDVHRYRVTVDFSAYKSSSAFWFGVLGQLATTKKFRTAFEVYVYRYKSQWWLESGELGLPEKVAMLPEARIVS